MREATGGAGGGAGDVGVIAMNCDGKCDGNCVGNYDCYNNAVRLDLLDDGGDAAEGGETLGGGHDGGA